ncbi:MAG: hypothetical protein ACLGGX_08540 [Bdellovibrionia bacterium]
MKDKPTQVHTINERHFKILQSSIAIATIVLLPILTFIYFKTQQNADYFVNFALMAINVVLLIVMHFYRKFLMATLIFGISIFVVLYLRSIDYGGIYAPAAYWSVAIPAMFAIAFEKRVAIVATFISIIWVIVVGLNLSSVQEDALSLATLEYRALVLMQVFLATSLVAAWQVFYSNKIFDKLKRTQELNRAAKLTLFKAEKAKIYNSMVDEVNEKNIMPIQRARDMCHDLAIKVPNKKLEKVITSLDKIETILIKARELKNQEINFVQYSNNQQMIKLQD